MSRDMTKPTKWHVRPAKTRISLGIGPVWSESSLSAWRKLGSLATNQAHSELWSDWADAQADLSLRWVHSHFVGFVVSRLIFIFRSKVGSHWLIRKYDVHPSNSPQDVGQNHWTKQYRSLWPIFVLRSKVVSHWLIFPKFDVDPSNSLQAIW